MLPGNGHELRSYIASKNYNFTQEESIYVIEWDNRDFKELLNHKQLSQAVEKIHGSDIVILEMTAITIVNGAIPQWFRSL